MFEEWSGRCEDAERGLSISLPRYFGSKTQLGLRPSWVLKTRVRSLNLMHRERKSV